MHCAHYAHTHISLTKAHRTTYSKPQLKVARSMPRVSTHLVEGPVEHEGATMDRAEAGEALRQAAKPVDRVDVRRLSVPL